MSPRPVNLGPVNPHPLNALPKPPPPPRRPPRPASLGGRLLAGSALFTLLALVVAFFVMQTVLVRFVTGQIDQRLDSTIVSLASQVTAEPDGTIEITGDADGPPFDKRRHGAFWWISGPRNNLHTNWLTTDDFTPPPLDERAPPPPPDDNTAGPAKRTPAQTFDRTGPDNIALHIRAARRLVGTVPVTIYVATPYHTISGPMREAMMTIFMAMGCLGVALLLAGFVQVRLGLRPLSRLRKQIAIVRSGGAEAVPVDQPREILPLVMELNSLLAQNAENLVRARRHVANLAHGLKTPLATLSLTVDRMSEAERAPLRDLVGMIERRIRHHLGRARAAALGGVTRTQTPLAARIRDLSSVLERIHADKQVVFTLLCSETVAVACEPQDIDEILGNLLDNAFKYTSRRVDCRVVETGRVVTIAIVDDGPGLCEGDIARVMHPGQRLDEAVPGFGFGLPIARELTELYGGSLVLSPQPQGLSVTLTLPQATAAAQSGRDPSA